MLMTNLLAAACCPESAINMQKKNEVNPEDYYWVITVTERSKETDTGWFESLLGLADEDGTQFVPVTAEKFEAETLLRLLPPAGHPDTLRQVEAMHKDLVRQQADEHGFNIYLVDGAGRIQGRIKS